MVLVDAVVTTKTGAAVRDLTAKDFHVWEDGKPQTIQSVSFVADPSPARSRPTWFCSSTTLRWTWLRKAARGMRPSRSSTPMPAPIAIWPS